MQATAETFLDGFMQTGDVFEQRGPGRIIWIDRKSNVMKLSQVRCKKPSSPAICLEWEVCNDWLVVPDETPASSTDET